MASTTRYLYTDTTDFGLGGIKGQRFENIPGWESSTVGFAGNVYSRLASEMGIQPTDPNITAGREPFKIGRFLLKVLRMPAWFDVTVKYIWRYIIEDTTLEVSGISDYTFNVFTKEHGPVKQKYAYGGTYTENNGEFTIRVPETAGQLVRKAENYWVFGMRDPKTNVAHYYGKDVRDLQPNKSMSFLYILLGPTCRPEDIEFACMWHDAIITNPKQDHNNSGAMGESGEGVEIDITFSGIYDFGPEINKLAAMMVDVEGLYEERAQNAVLPDYIYNNYLGGKGGDNLSKRDYGIDINSRIKDNQENTSDRQFKDSNGQIVYGSDTMKVRNAVRAANSHMFNPQAGEVYFTDETTSTGQNGYQANPLWSDGLTSTGYNSDNPPGV